MTGPDHADASKGTGLKRQAAGVALVGNRTLKKYLPFSSLLPISELGVRKFVMNSNLLRERSPRVAVNAQLVTIKSFLTFGLNKRYESDVGCD